MSKPNSNGLHAGESAAAIVLRNIQVGGGAQQTVEESGGTIEWPKRMKARSGQIVTFPVGTVWASLGEEEEARYRLADALDRRWLRLPDGALFLVYNRMGTVYLVVPSLIDSSSLDGEIEFFRHRWFEYQQAVQHGRSAQGRDPLPVMHQQLLQSAARIAALVPYDRQLRLAERGVSGTPDGTLEQSIWQAVRDTYAHFPTHGDPLAALGSRLQDLFAREQRAGDQSRCRLLLASVFRELAGSTVRLLYAEHTQTVRAVAWSPDGSLIASAGDGGKLHFCDANAAAHRVIGGWYNDTLSLSWSPDSARISSLSSGGCVQTWAVRSGALLQDMALDLPVKAFAWSPDGSKLALAGGKERGRLCIVDLASGKTLLEGALDADPLMLAWSLSWSPDGTHLAAADGTGQVSVWEASSPGQLPVKRLFSWRVFAVAFATRGNLLALGGEGGSIEVWDLGEGSRRGSFAGHAADVRRLSWSPGGVYLASTAADATLRIWRAGTREPLLCHQGAGAFGQPLWSPSSRAVACANQDGTIHVAVWDGQAWQPAGIYLGHLGCWIPEAGVAFSPDGNRLASVARELRIDARNFAVHVWFPPGSASELQAAPGPLPAAGDALA